MNELLERAAEILDQADALLVTAGAGMGVDSGLPDFRGNEGFWNAYPPYRKLGRGFVEMANPAGFASDPAFAWGFYGHRLQLYRDTEPHQGFSILRKWGEKVGQGAFVVTSNVDGHFQRAGFAKENIYEVHGSIHHLQCSAPCQGSGIWAADEIEIEVDLESMRAKEPLPKCPRCGSVARPNILMFGDWNYLGDRNEQQRRLLEDWLEERRGTRMAILEFGAGSHVPTVRLFSEDICRQNAEATLIRVNPREPEAPFSQASISIAMGALETLEAIQHSREEMS